MLQSVRQLVLNVEELLLGKRLRVDLVTGAWISCNSLRGAAPSSAMFYTNQSNRYAVGSRGRDWDGSTHIHAGS